MARNFAGGDREQGLLMPRSLTEWLPENHLVWTILGAVKVMDLRRFEEAYRLVRRSARREQQRSERSHLHVEGVREHGRADGFR
jgi:hypothetical protein